MIQNVYSHLSPSDAYEAMLRALPSRVLGQAINELDACRGTQRLESRLQLDPYPSWRRT